MVARKSKLKPIPNADGSVSYVAQVRVKGFRPVAKSFCSADYEGAAGAAKKAAEADAIQWREETIAELRKQSQQGAARSDISKLTIAGLNKEYLADPVTAAKAYFGELKRNLSWWTSHYGTVRVLEFGVVHGRGARDKLMAGRGPATVDRYLSAQRSAWNFGRKSGLVPKDRVWPPGLMLSEPDARVRYLDDEELPALLTAAEQAGPVLHAAILASIACGMRKGELLRLTWADIDFERSSVRILITKNGRARSVYLPTAAAAALKKLKASTVVSTTHVFLNGEGKSLNWNELDKRWRPVRTAAKLENFRWHDLRHCCASFLAQSGASLLEIGSVLGHRSAGVTLKYSHLIAGQAVTGHAKLNERLGGKTAS
ncbi:MAG TPA: site-specific integrase [Steroidobacteraceae bacterium]|jgi:integrase|nr:site-specific integrase [Steroidobacteraceae bacterium]